MKPTNHITRNLRVRPKQKRGGKAPRPEKVLPPKPGNFAYWRNRYLEHLRHLHYRETTITGRFNALRVFLEWAHERGLDEPQQITRSILESYRRYLYHWRKQNGQPLSVTCQCQRLQAVQYLFRWLYREYAIEADPAAHLEMPRLEKTLPHEVFTRKEIATIMNTPDTSDLLGVRDRAILELLYSSGIRRSECARLELRDLKHEQKTLHLRQTKSRRDRFVPVGKRAMQWLERYLGCVRPQLLLSAAQPALFITSYGEAFNVEVLGRIIRRYVKQSGVPKKGGSHMLRHSCATHMLEAGADIRFIQQLLGHANLNTTSIYTEVNIKTLQVVHARTHPSG